MTMEEQALKLRNEVDAICIGFHYYKNEKVLQKSKELAISIKEYCSYFLQGNIFGMEETEYLQMQQYVMQVLNDYIEADACQDMVYMLDTLDYGLRELLNIFIDTETGGEALE